MREKILVIEDDPEVSEFCRDVLVLEGYTVDLVKSGETALEMVKTNYYNLALVDLKLPGMDGIEVLHQIHQTIPDTLVIMFSGFGTIEKAVLAMRAGAYDYLPKPLTVDELRIAVRRCLNEQRMSSELDGLKSIKSLYRTSILMSSLIDLEKILELVLRFACDIVKADSGSLMLLDNKNQELTVGVSWGMSTEIARTVRIKVGERIAGWVAQSGESLLLVDGLNKDARFSHIPTRDKIKSSICVPLKIQNKVIGVLCINSERPNRIFRPVHLEMLKELAEDAAVAIENARVYEQLKQVNRMKSEFVSIVSHDLRTPLTVVKTAAESLLDNVFGPLNDQQSRWIREIVNSINNLNRLISEILDIAKIESGKMEINRIHINFAKLLDKVSHELNSLVTGKKIRLSTNLPEKELWLKIDPVRIEQVLTNLISNAVKFTPEQGTIELIVETEDNFVKVTVRDTGTGIPSDEIDFVFDQFYQVKRSVQAGRTSGYGLGLAIAKEIIHQHQGKIWVQSKLNQGSSFIFTLPRQNGDN